MITGDENSDDEISDDEISDDEISCDEISDDEISDDEISGNPFLIQIYRFDRFAKNKHFKITSSTLPRFSNFGRKQSPSLIKTIYWNSQLQIQSTKELVKAFKHRDFGFLGNSLTGHLEDFWQNLGWGTWRSPGRWCKFAKILEAGIFQAFLTFIGISWELPSNSK